MTRARPLRRSTLPALVLLLAGLTAGACGGGVPEETDDDRPLVSVGPDGRLAYAPANSRGDVIPDFSACGYQGGGVKIPDVPARVRVEPGPGDDVARIQGALDEAGELPWASDGFRGAVELAPGVYEIGGTLRFRKSGVVLRGAGPRAGDEGGTELRATGGSGQVVIDLRGAGGIKTDEASAAPVADAVVPVGAATLRVAATGRFALGERVIVRRFGNAAWIREIGMDRIETEAGRETKQWEPFTLSFDRRVVTMEPAGPGEPGHRLTLDAPITCAIEERWGGGEVVPQTANRRLEKVGVEDLLIVSEFDPSVRDRLKDGTVYYADEDHAARAVKFHHCRDGWVRRAEARHFVGGLLKVTASRGITASGCACLDPVSKVEGGRRYAFDLNGGAELCLVRDCRARYGRHDFVFGSRVCGPNVFLRCVSENPLNESEPHQRWAVGGLYDNVRAPIFVQDRGNWGTGHGWGGANFVLWNCTGEFVLQSPPTAENYAIGHDGPRARGRHERPVGRIERRGKTVRPVSLYEGQVRNRTAPTTTDP